MKHNDLAAFHLDLKAPSIFTTGDRDGSFKALTTSPLTLGQLASLSTQRREEEHGRNPGTIYGLSAKGDNQIHPRRGTRG